MERISDNIATLSQAKSRDIQVKDTTSSTGFRSTISTTELRLAQQRIETEEENRRLVQADRSEAADSLQKYQVAILDANIGNDIAAELGPLKYLSGLTGISMDRIINILLLIIIFVFDPLAVSMVLAANYAFDIARDRKEEEEKEPREDWEKFFKAAEEEELELSPEDVETVVEADKNPPEPNEKLKEAVETHKEVIKEPKTRKIVKVLQRTPSKRRVLFDDGKEGWVNKGDEDKIIYM